MREKEGDIRKVGERGREREGEGGRKRGRGGEMERVETCWVMILQLWYDESLAQVASRKCIHKHLIALCGDSIVCHLIEKEH